VASGAGRGRPCPDDADLELYEDADWERTLGEVVGPLVAEGLPLDAYFTLPDLSGAPRRTLLSLLPAETE
jgi:hypothetical protein